ncbi:MAG: hypothetical protein LBT43_09840 [Prevotella sp.]|jgi:hypothetical protein|nr:hypothetical protein [Prevotella sp.]
MKTAILIFCLLSSSLGIKSQSDLPYKSLQEFRNDTLSFAEYNFGKRRQFYQGKTFENFVKDLKIEPKRISFGYARNDMFAYMLLTISEEKNIYIYIYWELGYKYSSYKKNVDLKDRGWTAPGFYNYFKEFKIKEVNFREHLEHLDYYYDPRKPKN